MLVSLVDVLKEASAGAWAVPAFDCTEDLMIRPILDTCEAQGSPVILMALEHDLVGRGFDYIASIVRGVAPKYSVPIVLHLDHATRPDLVAKAIDYGFTSVMYDGSALPFSENVRVTRQVVKIAHAHGVAVEAELGKVAGKELDGSNSGDSQLTDPSEVLDFIALTGVDALAVSIGTAHGVYASAPRLDILRLKEIRNASKVPLVLHGGSGTPLDQVQDAIRNGIAKVNLYSDIRAAMLRGLKTAVANENRIDPLPDQLFRPVKEAIARAVESKIAMTMSGNRVKAANVKAAKV
ncbi:MAG TPA: ketose-bisphosphate aldolase [Treponema sp.]|nr:MAG: ketose-bisphosphate aldolase [Treponema sp. RIFOXYC1_FULL_61_9]OHE69469.1 MAG: ketose-bisphosphate aldolase [Treponema sp. GWC1_61_84]HCM27391.1 ketose-bisphosphate aldolase [Treponema sp.]